MVLHACKYALQTCKEAAAGGSVQCAPPQPAAAAQGTGTGKGESEGNGEGTNERVSLSHAQARRLAETLLQSSAADAALIQVDKRSIGYSSAVNTVRNLGC